MRFDINHERNFPVTKKAPTIAIMPIMIGLVFTSFLVVLYVDFLCVFLALCWAWASLLRSLYTYVVQHILKGSHFIIWSFLMILPFVGSIWYSLTDAMHLFLPIWFSVWHRIIFGWSFLNSEREKKVLGVPYSKRFIKFIQLNAMQRCFQIFPEGYKGREMRGF